MFSRFPKFFLQNQHFAAKLLFLIFICLFVVFFFPESSVESLFSSCFYFVYFCFSYLLFIFSCFFGLFF